MSQWYGNTRTNYFRVNNEEKYKELFKHLVSDSGDNIADFSKNQNDEVLHAFGTYGSIDFLEKIPQENNEDLEYNFDCFISELQKILPDNEAFIMIESGNEKLRTVTGYALVVTRDKIQNIELRDWAVSTAKQLLNNPNFETQVEY